MNKLPDPIPAESQEVKQWREAGMPTFQHFSSREELEAHLKYVEENEGNTPF